MSRGNLNQGFTTVAVLGVSSTLAALFLLTAPIASAQTEGRVVVERVVAVVNDDAIWLSEVRRRSMPFFDQVVEQTTPDGQDEAIAELYGRVLDSMVDERLLQDAAADLQVRVTQAEVERAIDNVREQAGLTEEEFWPALRAQGMTEAQYRSDVRRSLLRLKVLNTRARGRVNITEQQVREQYMQYTRRASRSNCYEISVRAFRVPSADQAEQARIEAVEVRMAITPDTFDGIDLGTVCEGQMQGAIDEALETMEVGQISQPVRTENGYVLLYLREHATGEVQVEPYDDVRQRLFQEMLEAEMARQEQIFVRELRRDAVVDRRL